MVQADKALLAPVYPGSLMIKQEQTKKSCYFSEGTRGEVFYTRDDIEQVLSFSMTTKSSWILKFQDVT